MTPAARVAAAIAVLDQIQNGQPAEAALLAWSRSSRFAGSKDRAAVRDHVFDVLRTMRSSAAMGGGDTGRALMIGNLRTAGADLTTVFTGEGHAPATLTSEETDHTAELTDQERCDWPDWLWQPLVDVFGDDAAAVAMAQRDRANVFIRTNTKRISRDRLIGDLRDFEIDAEPVEGSTTALRILSNPRRLQQSPAWEDGLFDMQDASSQIAIERLPISDGAKVLDYCAGGGGKSLGMADRGATVTAHDGDPARMKDIAPRAKRAGVRIAVASDIAKGASFDGVLCDAPCSGSGTWRRTPDAKWKFTPARLAALNEIQLSILNTAQKYVSGDGWLAYATCSVIESENRGIVDQFMSQNPEWTVVDELRRRPTADGDGFYQAILRRT